MKRVKLFVAALAVMVCGGLAVVPSGAVHALDPTATVCADNPSSPLCKKADASSLIGTIVNTLLYLVGILSVIMIIVGGILYTISSGDSGKVSKAKNTIMYAVVGLVVSFIAFAIVNWVLKLF